jgi:DMSO/TMAO reductase YedYZ molybdopterin-dependent catalytic subunit
MVDAPESPKSGRIKDKLIVAKQKWAAEGRLLTGKSGADRLPPGQRLVRDWPVLDLGLHPETDLDSWRLKIDGLVETPVDWTWSDLLAQPQTDDVSDIHCVTSWSRYDNHWTGVAAVHVLALVQPRQDANYVVFHAADGYTTNVRRDMFDAQDVILAHSWEGKPLTREHGGPLRVVMPQYYFWKSAKWLTRIEFVAIDRPGFWEIRGYHNQGDPWTEERYS